MLLAELEVWHSRSDTPTRRIALGNLVLPVEPAPGFGGLLLGAVVARHLAAVDTDFVADLHRLLSQVQNGDRVVQPRLRHRFQVDRHGLARSTHQMFGDGESVHFNFDTTGSPLAQVLGAMYSIERLEASARQALAPVMLKAMAWRGPLGASFVTYLAGSNSSSLAAMADPRAWALELFGFPLGTAKVTKKEVMLRYREQLRVVHPDHGGNEAHAGQAIIDLGEARKILLA